MAEKTVSCHVTTAFKANGEEDIVTTQRFVCGPPRDLIPEIVESFEVDTENVGRVTAGLAMAKDPIAGARQMAASLLRENRPIQAVRDTISHAGELLRYVLPNGRCAPSGALWLKLAVASPLCASGLLSLPLWTPAAAYTPAAMVPIAGVACLLFKLAALPTILALCLMSL